MPLYIHISYFISSLSNVSYISQKTWIPKMWHRFYRIHFRGNTFQIRNDKQEQMVQTCSSFSLFASCVSLSLIISFSCITMTWFCSSCICRSPADSPDSIFLFLCIYQLEISLYFCKGWSNNLDGFDNPYTVRIWVGQSR